MADKLTKALMGDREAMQREYPNAADRIYGPDMRSIDLDSLMRAQQTNMPEYTVDPNSGRVPQFAGPQSMAPPMDRQSENVRDYDFQDLLVNSLAWAPVRKLVGLGQYGGAKFGLTPNPSMQEIGDLLPKQKIPYMGPSR